MIKTAFCCARPLLASIVGAALLAVVAIGARAENPPPALWDTDPGLELLDAIAAEPVIQLAHAGQLSPKDDCHRHKAAGERHWHKDESATRGGPCLKVDGETYRFLNHAVCAEERIFFMQQADRWSPDWASAAERLKACIQNLPPPRGN